jgi:two-component system sensor histidine kinase GlrK
MLAHKFSNSGTILRFGSLRQLILGSFILALIPLIALLWQSKHDLVSVSKMTTEETRFIANIVRKVQQIDGTSLALERAIRQYRVLRNERVGQLTQNALSRFASQHQELCQLLSYPPVCGELRETYTLLSGYKDVESNQVLDDSLFTLGQQLPRLRDSVDEFVQQRLDLQQSHMLALQAQQAWLTALLVSISLLLILLGSQLIINPVRKLKLIIQMLAHQQGKLPPISRKAPTELIAVEKDLHWLGERLSQLENIRTALLRHAAHELKTPLASIKEGCSLLSDGTVGALTDAQKEVLSLLDNSTQRLNTLIEKLLDYNLLLQQAQPSFCVVDIRQMVQDCIDDYQLALKQQALEVKLDVDNIIADHELLRRILDNLVSNAVAHGAKGRPISIQIRVQEGYAIVDVANRGKKIPAEKVASLFEPFVRGNDERNDNVIGTGLGLSIVADCARIMHGDAQVVDVDYADVCFRVRIPQQEM